MIINLTNVVQLAVVFFFRTLDSDTRCNGQLVPLWIQCTKLW